MHYTPNFCGCHFLPRLPLGHLSNSKFHGGLWCKRWENKICKGFHAKDAMFMQESKWNWGKFKHAMVEIKYGITTDLLVGARAQSLESFEWDISFRQPWLARRNNSKVWHRFMKIVGRIRTSMWCLGSSGLSFGPLSIGLNFSWYISSRSIAPKMLEITYLDCTIMWSLSRLM